MDITALNQSILLFIDKNGVLVPAPGLQPGYGPHASLAAAQTALIAAFDGSISKVPQGYTFCVIENNKPVEYWFYKSGGWYVERKNVSTSQSSDQTNYLGKIDMKVDDNGVLWFSVENGADGTWKYVGSVRQPADLTKIRLAIVAGKLYITRDGSDPRTSDTRDEVGTIGGDGDVIINGTTTYIKFDEAGYLRVRYGEDGPWELPDGVENQGKVINESIFQNLLEKYFKIAVKDGFIQYSYKKGIEGTWVPLHKLNEESSSPSVIGKYKVTFKVYLDSSANEDIGTKKLLVDDNGIVNGDSMYLESGDHHVTVTCTGYETQTVPFTVEDRDTLVEITLHRDPNVASCRLTIKVRDKFKYDVTGPATVILNGKERDSIMVFSGAFVDVQVMYSGYYDVVRTIEVTENKEEVIDLTPLPDVQESEWVYSIINGLPNHGLIHNRVLLSNDGEEGVSHYVTAYRQSKLTGVRERLQLIKVYNPDADPEGQSMNLLASQRPTDSGDQIHSDYSIYMTLDFPPAVAEYLYGGYEYKVRFEWRDNEGNIVYSNDSWNYEGIWERHIELYSQDVYVDNVHGSRVVLKVDSYCVKAEECPGTNNYIYPCPLELVSGQTGITQYARNYKYLNWIKDSSWPDWTKEYDDYGHGSYAKIRNVFTLDIDSPENIPGAIIDPSTGNYIIPISFRREWQQHPEYEYQSETYKFVPSDTDFLTPESIEVACRTHQVTGIDRAAVGDIAVTRDAFTGLEANQKAFRTLLLKCIYREQAGSSAESSLTFCGADIEITAPGGVPLYSAKLTPQDNYYGFTLSNEQFESDDYIIDIECKREYQSTAPKGPNKNIEIRFCHVHNYVQDRVYTVRVTPFGGATTEFTFTLERATLVDGVALYTHQYMDTYNAGSAYFGIVGNHSTDEMNTDVAALAYGDPPRSNRDQITVTPVSASELPATLKPKGGRSTNQVLGIDEPFRVDNSVTVTWFRVDFPEVPQTSDDLAVNACRVYVKDEDMPNSDWVFQGEQKRP